MKIMDLISPHFKSQWRVISAGLLALIFVDLLQLLIPRVIGRAVDDLTLLDADLVSLGLQALTLTVLALLIGTFRYIWRRCLLGTACRLEETLRNQLLGHIQTLPPAYFDHAETGDLMAHATSDVQQVRMAAGMGLVAINDALLLGAASIGFMLYIHVSLTLYILIPMPLIVLSTRLLGKRMHQGYKKVQTSFSDLTEAVREQFAGIRMIKAHHGEQAALRSVQSVSRNYVGENIKLVGVISFFFPVMILLTNLSLALVLYFGGRRTIMGEITPGDFVAFISYLGLLAWPMMALGWVTNLIQRGGASLERLRTIFERLPEIADHPHARPLPRASGAIAFENLSFAYDRHNVLSRIDLKVAPGEVLGIVGPAGGGKSTLLRLVLRLYQPGQGRVKVDGYDVSSLRLADLRRNIAYVPQEPFLFAGTIRENILFGVPQASQERMAQSIEDAVLSATIASFPAGLDSVVGEKGILLSGGQKQRIALARALLVDAPILLLDDPFSQVDMATGSRIADTIARLAGAKTILIVSHRLSAVRFADHIICLSRGDIVESGTHRQLLSADGYYARIHALQEMEDAI